jgi:hypothetical protein
VFRDVLSMDHVDEVVPSHHQIDFRAGCAADKWIKVRSAQEGIRGRAVAKVRLEKSLRRDGR